MGGVGNAFNGAGTGAVALDRSRCPTEDAPDEDALPDGTCDCDCDLNGKKNREPPELGPEERVRGMVEGVRSK